MVFVVVSTNDSLEHVTFYIWVTFGKVHLLPKHNYVEKNNERCKFEIESFDDAS